MPVEIKELVIRALIGNDTNESTKPESETDQKITEKNSQVTLSKDTIAMVTEMLNKQKER